MAKSTRENGRKAYSMDRASTKAGMESGRKAIGRKARKSDDPCSYIFGILNLSSELNYHISIKHFICI